MTASDLSDDPQCTATSKRSQERCKRAPVPGSTVCPVHGGSAPQVRRAAEQRLAVRAVEADAAAALAAEGVALDGDPYALLEALAAETLVLKSGWAARVAALGPNVRYESAAGSEQIRAEVVMYERFIGKATKLLEILVRLGLDERRVEVQERLADQFSRVINGVLGDLELSPEQAGRAPVLIARHLRLLGGGA